MLRKRAPTEIFLILKRTADPVSWIKAFIVAYISDVSPVYSWLLTPCFRVLRRDLRKEISLLLSPHRAHGPRLARRTDDISPGATHRINPPRIDNISQCIIQNFHKALYALRKSPSDPVCRVGFRLCRKHVTLRRLFTTRHATQRNPPNPPIIAGQIRPIIGASGTRDLIK